MNQTIKKQEKQIIIYKNKLLELQKTDDKAMGQLDSCGNGICESNVCLAIECPEPETSDNCPLDCND